MTLLQVVRNLGQNDTFTFIVDESVANVTVFITGRSVTVSVTGPTGKGGLSLLKQMINRYSRIARFHLFLADIILVSISVHSYLF